MEAEKQTRTAQGSPEGGGSAGEKRANLAVSGGEESTKSAVSGGEESTKSAAGGGEESAKPAVSKKSTNPAVSKKSTKSAVGTGEKKRAALDAPLAFRLIAVGMTAGVINGVFGTGGGTVIVFALSALAGRLFPDRRMIFANAIAIILPPAVVSTLVYASFSPPDPATVTAIALCSLAGGALGALLLGKLKGRVLRLIFAVLMILSGGIMLFR